jgi:hypothetical protein
VFPLKLQSLNVMVPAEKKWTAIAPPQKSDGATHTRGVPIEAAIAQCDGASLDVNRTTSIRCGVPKEAAIAQCGASFDINRTTTNTTTFICVPVLQSDI